ncbi:hypothetical protein [Endothiovibrio diazotrophicus]
MARDDLISPPQPIPYGRPMGPVGDREHPQEPRRRPPPRRRRSDEEDEPPRRRPGESHWIDEYV